MNRNKENRLPCEVLMGVINEKHILPTELQMLTGWKIEIVNGILNGRIRIIEETATDLERVLGIAKSFWLELEQKYRGNYESPKKTIK